MSSSGSVSIWIAELKNGESLAAQRLWEGYFPRLVGLARKKLREMPRRVADEEDVALSAFDSFCRGAERGRFPRLDDRDDLWQLLVMITARKAADLAEHVARDKRDWRRTRGLDGPAGDDSSVGPEDFLGLLGREPDPAFAAQVADECRRLLDRLGEEELRTVAVLKMEGHTNEEIKNRLGWSLAKVERKLKRIRQTWEEELPR